MKDNKNFPWIVTKLSEEGTFNEVPVIFTSDESMYAFENMGYRACAMDLISYPIRQDVFVRRFENLVEIYHLKKQMNKMSSIQTKRILNQANMLKEQSNKMNTMNFELVELLVAAIESRDMESGQHIKRIKYFTKALTDVVVKECPEYNISAIQAEYIFLASSVHDIGKIAIPDAIMLKPGGYLLYSTCTFSKMEDEDNIQEFLDNHSEFSLERIYDYEGFTRAFGMEDDEIEEYDNRTSLLFKLQVGVGRISALMNPVTLFIINGATIILVWTGAIQANDGRLSQGEVIALVNYMSQILHE